MSKRKVRAFGATGFGLIIAAPFFLFNPEYSVIDFLPDFIGYALILIALRKLRDTETYFEDSFSAFVKLFFLTAAKAASVVLLFSGFFDESNRATYSLLFAFLFCLGEVILLRSAWGKLFRGLDYLADDGDRQLFRGLPVISVFTFVFTVVKAVLAVLPEFSVLSSHTYDEGHFDWSEFLWLFRVSSVMVGLVSGLVWLVFITVFFVKIRGARATFERASELYEANVLSRPSVRIRRSIRAASFASGIYFLLLSDLFFDGVNVLPNFLAAGAAIVAFVFLGRFSKLKFPGIVTSVLLALVSAISWVLSFGFAERWQWSDVQRRPEAWADFWRYYPLKIAGSALAAAVSIMILCAFARVARDHCGYIPSSAGEIFASERLREIRRDLYRRLRVCAVFAVLSALSSGLFDYMVTLPYGINFSLQSRDPAAYAKYVITGLLGGWWAVSLILSLIVFILFLRASSAIVGESDSRYLLE